jgi:SAM-dependent MidA family methyltransferase
VGPLFGAVLARALAGAQTIVEVGSGSAALARSITAVLDVDYVQVEFADAMPSHVDGVIIANELLDNLPFRLFERSADGWAEVYVEDGRELLVPGEFEFGFDAPVGARVPLQERAAAWVRDATAAAPRVIAFDYARTTAEMAALPWTEWLRTYRAHGRGGHPLEHVGEQDITCDVAVDQLPTPTRVTTQAEFLRAHGIDELVAEARAAWQERAHVGDLEALKHRSRLSEAAALTDMTGLGGFSVLEWIAT